MLRRVDGKRQMWRTRNTSQADRQVKGWRTIKDYEITLQPGGLCQRVLVCERENPGRLSSMRLFTGTYRNFIPLSLCLLILVYLHPNMPLHRFLQHRYIRVGSKNRWKAPGKLSRLNFKSMLHKLCSSLSYFQHAGWGTTRRETWVICLCGKQHGRCYHMKALRKTWLTEDGWQPQSVLQFQSY